MKKRKKIGVIFGTLVIHSAGFLSLSSCASAMMVGAALEPKRKISVVDEAGNPVEGVSLSMGFPFAYNPLSNSRGVMKIPVSSFPPSVELTKDGYAHQKIDVSTQRIFVLKQVDSSVVRSPE